MLTWGAGVLSMVYRVRQDRSITQGELEHVRDVLEREVASLKEELRAAVSKAGLATDRACPCFDINNSTIIRLTGDRNQ